ncbi:TPA: hypothetical protein OMI73_000523 [Klebsiella pneumoniae]|uniref:hypothetical protein n=1 Tax=Klebsiella/Raoultella group TaxID=2890311 RepID=UPI00191A7ECE|nr:hypothetical protein [Klebsiella pneumoniae]EKZ9794963.1 hypothetical protein [Klebsiella pneumoniae]MCP5932506.1 hypothetical protein [Klebsiella pneumoniae]MCU6562452.1 hypothetical protein [Klebsiella pneumoniae]UZI69227.1 hypothetical protein JMW14_09055 [Klebsiella pneumoniae]HCQ9117568.1 hypothetical protein [Klebsiella pneumoniae]
MNDIELAQSLKRRATSANEFGESLYVKADDILTLVEALEKAQAKADVYDMLRDDYGLREKGVGLADFVDWQANRIAELESRTVKLPPCVDDLHGIGMVMSADAVVEALTSYGIKVEAE